MASDSSASERRSPCGPASGAVLLSLLALALGGCGGGGSEGGPAPTTPPPAPSPAPAPAPAPGPAGPTAFAPIDTARRDEVVARYWDSFVPLVQTPFSFTGNVSACQAGDTPPDYKQAVVRLLNYYRAMAGLAGDVTLSLAKSAKDQQAALMMDANDQLSHAPPASWACYTADGAEAAGRSNLAWGSPTLNGGIGSIPLYVTDRGVDTLGHRRWVLYSRLAEVGTGDTPQANALWVIGNEKSAVSVPKGVAWPPRGYVPWDSRIADPSIRWSFSYPNADFSTATVSMKDDAGAEVPLASPGAMPGGYGDNALAWSIGGTGTPWSRYPGDTKLTVTIRGVRVGGVATDFSYDVVFIKP